jgi:hypothetical protein
MRIIFLVFLITLSSCATKQFKMNEKITLKPSAEGKRHYVFWALGQDTAISGEGICKQLENVVAIDSYSSISDSFLTYLSGGIYSPKSYAIYCYTIPYVGTTNVSTTDKNQRH